MGSVKVVGSRIALELAGLWLGIAADIVGLLWLLILDARNVGYTRQARFEGASRVLTLHKADS